MSPTQLQDPQTSSGPEHQPSPTRRWAGPVVRDGAHFGRRRPILRAAAIVAAFLVGLTAVGLIASHRSGGPSRVDLHAAAALRPLSDDTRPATVSTARVAGLTTLPATTLPATTLPATTGPATKAPAPATPLAPAGSSVSVLVVFNGETVTVQGAVPNQADSQKLGALASAYSKTPNPTIVNQLTIDPSLPDAAGVRVIEMVAARFDPGSATVIPQQEIDFQRVVSLMKALPGLTVMAIGHADQQGNSAYNLQLSQARAAAVVDFLVAHGISPDRLSARGDGDLHPLTQQSDTAGLALNRRTEWVFYGLLAGS